MDSLFFSMEKLEVLVHSADRRMNRHSESSIPIIIFRSVS